MSIFCYQCEEAADGKGCSLKGMCGKDSRVAYLQNLLLAWCKHVGSAAYQMRQTGTTSALVDEFLVKALYSTLTNVNFDPEDLARQIFVADRIRQVAGHLSQPENVQYKESLESQARTPLGEVTEAQIDELVAQGAEYSVDQRQKETSPTVAGLQELVMCGIKGAAAYAWHAMNLKTKCLAMLHSERTHMERELQASKGKDTKSRDRRRQLREQIEANKGAVQSWTDEERAMLDGLWARLAFLVQDPTDPEALLNAALETGKSNLLAMKLLERGHIERFEAPRPKVVRLTPVAGKCILVSGHDLEVLYELLLATRGKGINVYTHGEMLSAHSYPALAEFEHLAGHYGGSWSDQRKEFDAFPGAILVTSNCIQEPCESYHDYIFTSGPTAYPGVKRLTTDERGRLDFGPVIAAANDSAGFFKSRPGERLTVGFSARTLLGMSPQLKKAIQQNQLRRFFLLAGCDGHGDKRDYFTQFAKAIPNDCMLLTLGCGKFRFNREEFVPLPSGLPRLLDMGQCSDATGAVELANGLAELLGRAVNQLPLTIVLSWYEQKAVAILLSLLSLGITGIRLGPSVPAFITPEILTILVDKYNLKLTGDPQKDLADSFGKV